MCGGKTHVVCGREVREIKRKIGSLKTFGSESERKKRVPRAREKEKKTFGSEREFLVRVVQMCAKKPPMGSEKDFLVRR